MTVKKDDEYKCTGCGTMVDSLDVFMIRGSGLCFDCYNKGPGKDKPAIREEDGLHEQWFKRAHEISNTDELKAFIESVMGNYVHDYGTVCHAVAASALAAARCADHHEGGGITGFQAGAVFWDFLREWLHVKGPAKLVEYDQMLYPQYEARFAPTINSKTWAWLQDEAKKKLAELETPDSYGAHEDIVAHWRSVVAGKVPFGYKIKDER